MQGNIIEGVVTVTLSRRNLLALLHKLDMAGSACTIFRDCGNRRFVVKSESDDVHYGERQPGPMHPDTEAFIEERQS